MIRIRYSEDEDFPGQFGLWQANCVRSLQSKKGQAALRELESALLALPDKRLIEGEMIDADGEVCPIGALAKYKGRDLLAEPHIGAQDEFDGDGEMEEIGVELGMPRLVAWKVVFKNDIDLEGVTPESRYAIVLAWVQRQLKAAEQ